MAIDTDDGLIDHAGRLPVVSFEADHATLSWPGLAGALRYNVYRGTLASLHDLGPDGAPADGYGSCLSGGDPNPSDLTLVDSENPDEGQAFFYVKSVVDAHGQERGLGATSAGRARSVKTPCLF